MEQFSVLIVGLLTGNHRDEKNLPIYYQGADYYLNSSIIEKYIGNICKCSSFIFDICSDNCWFYLHVIMILFVFITAKDFKFILNRLVLKIYCVKFVFFHVIVNK